MPAKSLVFNILRCFKFFFEIPPNTTIFFFVKLESNLNLLIPRKFLFFLNNEEMKIFLTF